jgi:hypothetical protein
LNAGDAQDDDVRSEKISTIPGRGVARSIRRSLFRGNELTFIRAAALARGEYSGDFVRIVFSFVLLAAFAEGATIEIGGKVDRE